MCDHSFHNWMAMLSFFCLVMFHSVLLTSTIGLSFRNKLNKHIFLAARKMCLFNSRLFVLIWFLIL